MTPPPEPRAYRGPFARRDILRIAGLSLPTLLEVRGAEASRDPDTVARFIEIQRGQLPIILCAPHGGRDRPDQIPDRTKGVFAFDTNTQELARACAEAFSKRFGKRIHLIICKLHRTKLDCNREPQEATDGNPVVRVAWEKYHAAITSAAKAILKEHQSGLLIDLHGHGHKSQTLELGYGLEVEDLALPDSALDAKPVLEKSTLQQLVTKTHLPHSSLLRGPDSLGALLEKGGYRAAPSPGIPVPTTPFFSGGYTIRRHTSEHRHLTGIQIETHSPGVRDTAPNRQAFGDALALACETFLRIHLDQNLPSIPQRSPQPSQP